MKDKILIIEDDVSIANLQKDYLEIIKLLEQKGKQQK